MGWKEFTPPLDPDDPDGDRIRVRLNTEQGIVVDFVVQYEVAIDVALGYYLPAVRFDATHGRPHIDYLTPTGEQIRKVWLPEHLTFGDAATYAIEQTKVHWRIWREQFLRQLGQDAS